MPATSCGPTNAMGVKDRGWRVLAGVPGATLNRGASPRMADLFRLECGVTVWVPLDVSPADQRPPRSAAMPSEPGLGVLGLTDIDERPEFVVEPIDRDRGHFCPRFAMRRTYAWRSFDRSVPSALACALAACQSSSLTRNECSGVFGLLGTTASVVLDGVMTPRLPSRHDKV